MKFRRNTHTLEGVYKNLPCSEEVWQRHGDIVHMLNSNKAMSFNELLYEIRKDITNYEYNNLPSEEQVALSLVKLIEENLVEVVQ